MIYSPREDSFLLEREVRKLAKGKSFLDMGSGSGIQAKAAVKAGAKSVLAADISSEAVKSLKSQKIQAVKSNLFSGIKKKKLFDIIAFNPPYLPEEKKEPAELKPATTGGGKGDEIILKFLKQAKSHLSKDGIILLILSSLTPKERINRVLERQKMKKEILASQSFFFEAIELWIIRK
jgi:release factor glutamine methyltransferase